jgi:ligand-binding sensor domain-containing protein
MKDDEMGSEKRNWLIGVQILVSLIVVGLCGWLTWHFYPQPKLPAGWLSIPKPQDVLALLEVGEQIWVGGIEGIAVLEGESGQLLHWVEADVPLAYVNSLTSDGQRIWASHERGVSQFASGIWQKLDVVSCQPICQVLVVYHGAQSGLWVGTTTGVAHLVERDWQFFTQIDGLAGPAVSVLFEDQQGRVWAGDGYSPGGGLSLFDGQSWSAISSGGVLAHNTVNAILETPTGELWFGTGLGSRGGATKFDGESWHSIYKSDGLAGERVRSMLLDQAGNLWFGSEVDGLAIFLQSGWLTLTPKEGLAGWEVRAILQDAQQNIWLGTNHGLTRIRADSLLELIGVSNETGS